MNIIEPCICDPVPIATYDLLAGPMRVKTRSDEFAGMLSVNVRFEEVPSTAFLIYVD